MLHSTSKKKKKMIKPSCHHVFLHGSQNIQWEVPSHGNLQTPNFYTQFVFGTQRGGTITTMRPRCQKKAICFARTDGWAQSKKFQFPEGMRSPFLYHSLLRQTGFLQQDLNITKTLLQEDHVLTTGLDLRRKSPQKNLSLQRSSFHCSPFRASPNQNLNCTTS